MKYPVLITVAGLVAAGGFIGNATADPPVEYVKGPTEYVQAPIPEPNTVTVYEVPESCLDALDQANIIWQEAGKIDTKSSEILDIISKVRILLFKQDVNGLATVEDHVRNLQAKTVGNVQKLSEASFAYQQDYGKCKQQLNE